MKILIICKPRTRSSFLCSALSNHYNLTNLHELFIEISKQVNTRAKFLKKDNDLNFIIENQKRILRSGINRANANNNCVFKLFPRDLIFSTKDSIIVDDSAFKHDIFLNFNEFFELENFDKIYFLDRDNVEAAISYGYAWVKDKFLFTDYGSVNYTQKNQPQVVLNEKDFMYINFFIYESVLLNKVKKFLDNKKLNYTYIDYADCPTYVQENLPSNIPNMYYESKFNYKELIKNYDECVAHIENKFKVYSEQLKDIEFLT